MTHLLGTVFLLVFATLGAHERTRPEPAPHAFVLVTITEDSLGTSRTAVRRALTEALVQTDSTLAARVSPLDIEALLEGGAYPTCRCEPFGVSDLRAIARYSRAQFAVELFVTNERGPRLYVVRIVASDTGRVPVHIGVRARTPMDAARSLAPQLARALHAELAVSSAARPR